jgi:RNA polymerase sigma-70 factor (ECF subfamily)
MFQSEKRNRAHSSRVRADVELALTFPRTAIPLRRHAVARVSAPLEDGALVAATLGGRSDAFEELVARYERAVYHLSLKTLRDAEEAKDATQEAFFKAYRGLGTFRPGARFSTWLFSIAYHACCDRIARRKRYTDAELPERADPAPGPEAATIARDEAEMLRTAIDELPERYRIAITLYHLQGKQYEEIAKVLDLPMGTVKTHLFRAKEILRRRLAGERDPSFGEGLR